MLRPLQQNSGTRCLVSIEGLAQIQAISQGNMRTQVFSKHRATRRWRNANRLRQSLVTIGWILAALSPALGEEPPLIETVAKDVKVECDGLGNTAELKHWLANHGGGKTIDGWDAQWSHDFVSLLKGRGATGSVRVTFTATDSCGMKMSTAATFSILDTKIPLIGFSRKGDSISGIISVPRKEIPITIDISAEDLSAPPTLRVTLLGGDFLTYGHAEGGFREIRVDRNHWCAASTLFRPCRPRLIAHIVLQGHQQEGAKSAFIRVHRVKTVGTQEVGKKPLRQIFGIFSAVARTAQVSIEREPVGLTERGQGSLTLLLLIADSTTDHAPMRGAKSRHLGANS
jgi:hypothetical protein